MDTLEITLQRKTDDGWPVVIEYRPANELTIRREGFWKIGSDDVVAIEKKLLPHHRDPVAYGTVLGEALFQNEVRDLFREARARTPGYLRVLFVVEDPTLKHLHWEWLGGPIRTGGKWGLLSLDQRLPFSLYLPSVTERHFPPLAKSDLQALVVVANPPQGNPYKLASFVQSKTISVVQQVLGDIPNELLADGDGGTELPTIDHLATQLSGKQYTLLYIIAHGMFQASSGETTLYLLDEQKQISPVPATVLIERLDMVQGRYGLPHFVFLATCESADPKAEALGALGGLAQRMVRELGIPAVVAMTQKVSIETANALAVNFFTRLCEHGEVDRALVEACAGLASRGDIAVPTLYSRLEGRPLFAVGGLREPTAREVKAALDKLDALVETRCPVLDEQYRILAKKIRELIDVANALLSDAARKEKETALAAINQLCEETLDLRFQELALGQEPPAYYAHECPFPGLYAFRMEDARFFFGRTLVIERLENHLKRSHFLAVLGPSGCGKSSVVLAGLIPRLQKVAATTLLLHYMTPTEVPLAKLQESTNGFPTDETVTHVLVVDQFEELFTLCQDQSQRKAFLAQLLSATVFRYVIITMRADFLGDCVPYPNLAEAVQNNLQLIAPMTTAELRSAMERQANQVHLRFEADLSYTILSQVEGEPGAMPLLQHLLRQLWERRHGRWLSIKEYRSFGSNIWDVIGHTADSIYLSLDIEGRETMRNIFLRLTRLDPEHAHPANLRDTRRRVCYNELLHVGEDERRVRWLVNELANARLVMTTPMDMLLQHQVGVTDLKILSSDNNMFYVEIAHEALIHSWPKLKQWITDDREDLLIFRQITEGAQEWERLQRDTGSLLHRGAHFDRVLKWWESNKYRLNSLEIDFILESKKLRQIEDARSRIESGRKQLVDIDELASRGDVDRAIKLLQEVRKVTPELISDKDLNQKIADVRRQVATRLVQEGEAYLSYAFAVSVEENVKYEKEDREQLRTDVEEAWMRTESILQEYNISLEPYLTNVLAKKRAEDKFKRALSLNPPPDTPVYVWIPAGGFNMGASNRDQRAQDDEKPNHTVYLSGFWIMRVPVTNRQFARFVYSQKQQLNASAGILGTYEPDNERWNKEQYALHPVTNINWWQANSYAQWVGGVLPTEAEWEKACKGGFQVPSDPANPWGKMIKNPLPDRNFPWGDGDASPALLNFLQSRIDIWTNVGSYPDGASPYGCLDMSGNVHEWIADWYGENYYHYYENSISNPYGPAEGSRYDANGVSKASFYKRLEDRGSYERTEEGRVLRGGSFKEGELTVRSTYRDRATPFAQYGDVGFRVVIPGSSDLDF